MHQNINNKTILETTLFQKNYYACLVNE